MAKIEVEVEPAVAQTIEKLTRKVDAQAKTIHKLTDENDILKGTLKSMNKAKDALLEVADRLDPFRYDDE